MLDATKMGTDAMMARQTKTSDAASNLGNRRCPRIPTKIVRESVSPAQGKTSDSQTPQPTERQQTEHRPETSHRLDPNIAEMPVN